GVVRGRHLRTISSSSVRGFVPFTPLATIISFVFGMLFGLPFFFSWTVSVPSTNAPHADPLRTCGTWTFSLTLPFAFTLRLSRLAGAVHAPVGSIWLKQTATENVQELSPHAPWSHASPSVHSTTLLFFTRLPVEPGFAAPFTLSSP